MTSALHKSTVSAGGAGLVVSVVGILAFALGGDALASQANLWLTLGLFAVSVDLIWGYCGLLSFGQAVFFGLGAFCYAWVTTSRLFTWPWVGGWSLMGIVLAMLVTALLAALLGYFLFYGHIAGAYFTIVTLALSFLMSSLGQGWNKVLGGYFGIDGVQPLMIGAGGSGWVATGALPNLIVVGIVIVLAVFVLRYVLSSTFGLLVDGVRVNERRLEFLGSRVGRTKLAVFTCSAALAGLAGALYASQSGFVNSDLMGVVLSTEVIIWVAVGGRRTLLGGLIGAVAVRGVGYLLSGVAVEYWSLFLGVLFLATVVVGSSGIIGLGRALFGGRLRRATSRRRLGNAESP
jgi:urea transport system permease protein